MNYLEINSQESLLEFLSNNLTSDKNLSIRGVARLCGVDDKSLISGADFKSQKLAQILTEQGFTAADLRENGFNAIATWLVIEYYAYESKAKAQGAKQIARTFGSIGIKLTFDKLTEAKVKTPELEPADKVQKLADALESVERIQNGTLPAALKQFMVDSASNILITASKSLPETKLIRMGAAQRAEELGYALRAGEASKLGKYLVKLGYLEDIRTRESRLCNGQLREINVYEVCPDLDEAIRDFFS